jgi:glycosyltransferase involved in cell wall biosynthesis
LDGHPFEMQTRKRKIRILHVLHSLGFGGAEKWFLHMLNHIDTRRYQIDVMIHEERDGYADEIKKLGANIITCQFSALPWVYGKAFRGILRRFGPYDIMQSHLATAGFHCLWAYQEGVPVRLVHKHTDEGLELLQARVLKRIGVRVSHFLISRYATAGIAVSRSAAQLFGRRWEEDSRWQLLYLGIDSIQFRENLNPGKLRQELGIPDDSVVIGHVGRFTKEKNHEFLLDIFAKVLELQPQAVLLLVGDGPLRPEVEAKAKGMGLAGTVLFAGLRKDVPALMRGVMDVLVLPSLYEGLPLALMETQTAGLPSIISSKVTAEADIIKPLITRLPLNDSPRTWAQTIIQAANAGRVIKAEQALSIMEQSPFNIENSCKKLLEIYDDLLSQEGVSPR